jgi:hypothetical protein
MNIEKNIQPQSIQNNFLCLEKEFPLKNVTAMDKKIGLLINFNEEKLKAGIKRFIV